MTEVEGSFPETQNTPPRDKKSLNSLEEKANNFLNELFSSFEKPKEKSTPNHNKTRSVGESSNASSKLTSHPKGKNNKVYNNSLTKKLNSSSPYSTINPLSNSSSKQILSSTRHSINEEIKKTNSSYKEKQLYSQRVEALKKRIISLKKHEEQLNNKLMQAKQKEKENERIQIEKAKLRDACDKEREKQNKELAKKKSNISKRSSEIQTKIIKKKFNETKLKKKADYIESREKQKRTLEEIQMNDQNYKLKNKITYNKAQEEKQKVAEEKFKQQTQKEEKLKAYYTSKNKENTADADKLKREFEELEKIEEECLNNIKKTQLNSSLLSRKNTITTSRKKKGRPRSTEMREKFFYTQKPFTVVKPGWSDTYYLTHRKQRDNSSLVESTRGEKKKLNL